MSECFQKYIKEFLESELLDSNVFYNEIDFQIKLAYHLANRNIFDNIYTEYFIPYKLIDNKEYPWKSQIYIDIVLEKNNKFYLIELKYKTKKLEHEQYYCFGEETYIDLLKNQCAKNNTCYDFWKDVKRIEYLKSRFSNIYGGIALLLTNDSTYWYQKNEEKSDYRNFSLKDENKKNIENKNITKSWCNDKSVKNKGERAYPIKLQKDYQIKWCNTKNKMFRYCFVEI